jgi:hypothetical protein
LNQKERSWGRKFSVAVRVSPLYGRAIGHERNGISFQKRRRKEEEETNPFLHIYAV